MNSMNRGLDGYYFRIKRDGKWQPACFSDLTEEEMMQVLEDKDEEFLRSLCVGLGKRIRFLGDELGLSGGKGE